MEFLDNKLLDLFFKVLPAIITAGVAFFIFTLGQEVTRERDEEKEQKESSESKAKEEKKLNELRELYFICLKRLQKGIQKQIEYFNKAINQLETDVKVKENLIADIVKCDISLDAYPNQILEIPKNDVFRFYYHIRNDNKYKRMNQYTIINAYYFLLEKTFLEFENQKTTIFDTIQNDGILICEYRDKVFESMNTYTQMKRSNTLNVDNPFYTEIKEIFNQYNDGELTSVDKINKKFLTPIMKCCNKPEYALIPETKHLFQFCSSAKNRFANIILTKESQLNQYKDWKKTFVEIDLKINEVIRLEFKDLQKLFVEEKAKEEALKKAKN